MSYCTEIHLSGTKETSLYIYEILFFLNVALCFARTAMKSLSNLVIFVALATLFHQSSGNKHHIRDKILKAHEEVKEKLAPYGKSKSLVSTRQTFDVIPEGSLSPDSIVLA